MDGLTLTDGSPGAQSVYLKALRLNHRTGPLCFQTLEKHNIFGWQIWLLFKHYFHEDTETVFGTGSQRKRRDAEVDQRLYAAVLRKGNSNIWGRFQFGEASTALLGSGLSSAADLATSVAHHIAATSQILILTVCVLTYPCQVY